MTAQRGGTRCRYCWRPADQEPESGATLHNSGCPEDPVRGDEMQLWKQGSDYGFADNTIPYWRYGCHDPSFILGYRVGKAEIDGLVEQAVEARNNYETYDGS